jgi:hypothetical protein
MSIDDDPKTPVPAPAPADAPADDQDGGEKPEGEQPEGDDAETEASTDDEDVGDGDDEQDDEDGDDEDGEQPKRKASRAERYKRRAEKAEAIAERLRSHPPGGSLPRDQASVQRAFDYKVWQEVGDPPDPNDAKYRNPDGSPNYARFEREAQGWENDRRAVSRQVRKEMLEGAARENERVGELIADHKERMTRLRAKVKDFDAIMARATVPVMEHVERLILESKRSDRISLHLAKDQSKLVKLNNMSPEAAAREIGRIEGRLSLPQPKAQTKARAPITPLRGRGTSTPSGLAAVIAYTKKRYGDRG